MVLIISLVFLTIVLNVLLYLIKALKMIFLITEIKHKYTWSFFIFHKKTRNRNNLGRLIRERDKLLKGI